jgi:hypothetical protein
MGEAAVDDEDTGGEEDTDGEEDAAEGADDRNE